MAIFGDDAFVRDGALLPEAAMPLLIGGLVVPIALAGWDFGSRWVCVDGPRIWVRRRWRSWPPPVDLRSLVLLDELRQRGGVPGTGMAVFVARCMRCGCHATDTPAGAHRSRLTLLAF